MLISSLSLGLMGFFIKVSYQRFPELGAFDVLLVRSTLMLLAYYPYATYQLIDLFDLDFKYAKLLFFNSFLGVGGMLLLFISMHYLPASISFMIFNINPMVVFVLAYFFLHEDLTITRIF